MDELTEDELVEYLTWSDHSYSLASFLDEYQLPQVIRVVEGYDGPTDSSSLSHGEVLTLHTLRSIQKLAAEDSHGRVVTIPVDFTQTSNTSSP